MGASSGSTEAERCWSLMHPPVGQGHIIAFAEDPNIRGFTGLTQMLMMNAVLFGPAR
jgi:hypothetical protein